MSFCYGHRLQAVYRTMWVAFTLVILFFNRLRYKPSSLAHIKTYAFRYPNIPKDHTVNVPYYGCSPFSRRGVDRFGPAKVRDASARQRIITLSPPFYYRATTRNGCFTVEARLSSGLAFNRFVPSVSIRVFYVPRKPT